MKSSNSPIEQLLLAVVCAWPAPGNIVSKNIFSALFLVHFNVAVTSTQEKSEFQIGFEPTHLAKFVSFFLNRLSQSVFISIVLNGTLLEAFIFKSIFKMYSIREN